MPLKPPRPEGSGTPRLAQPFLHVLDRMQDRTPLGPEKLVEFATERLTDVFGAAPATTEAAFAHGVVGLMSEHTHYFPGFALLMPMHQGTAVAARVAEGPPTRYTRDDGPAQDVRAAHDEVGPFFVELLRLLKLDDRSFELAVVGTIPRWWRDASMVALGVAAARALQSLTALTIDTPDLMRCVVEAVSQVLGMPFSIAYPLAADVGRPGHCVLVDSGEQETLTLPGPQQDLLAWGAVDVETADVHPPDRFRDRHALAERALETLRRGGFAQLTSFRDLEHRDLERALQIVPPDETGVVRYLVTENRRVQKMVAAVRRGDWQLLGALMLMSHAIQRDDWGLTTAAVDHVVAQVEEMSLEGLYGARRTGRRATVLFAGQTFVVPAFLDKIVGDVSVRFGITPETLLL